MGTPTGWIPAGWRADAAETLASPDYAVGAGPAYGGMDVRAFILPTFHDPDNAVYLTPQLKDNIAKYNALSSHELEETLGNNYLSSLAGVSVSLHRDKFSVLTLGRSSPSGDTYSPRTIAGTLVFWLTDTMPLQRLLKHRSRVQNYLADELPRFDLYLTFESETGFWSSAGIYGLTILDEGYVIESTAPTVTIQYSYKALDCSPVTPGYFSIMPQAWRNEGVERATRVEHGSFTREGKS